MTVRETLRNLERRLGELRIRDVEAEARILVAYALQDTVSHLPTRLREDFPSAAERALQPLLERRLRREPLAYITGSTEFMGLPLKCDARALVPRPDTETLVQVALDKLAELFPRGSGTSPLVADIGTGAGGIAVTLAHYLPHIRVVATDISPEALELAHENVALNGLAERVTLLSGPFLQPLVDAGLAAEVAAVVCNPPYISSAQLTLLEPEVLDQEPRVAYEGGTTGLAFYEAILPELRATLPACRLVAFEFGFTQEDQIATLATQCLPGWALEIRRDLSGIERVISAVRP